MLTGDNPEVLWAEFSILSFAVLLDAIHVHREHYRGKYHCTIDLLFDWFGISCMTADNYHFYLQNRLILTGQTGGQLYSDTSPFSVPWYNN